MFLLLFVKGHPLLGPVSAQDVPLGHVKWDAVGRA